MRSIWSPAHQAIENEEIFELVKLLDSGTDPNEVCGDMTLLAHAVDYEADGAIQSGSEMEVAYTAVLLAFGADPMLAAEGGISPMEIADQYPHDAAKRLMERFISASH
ncbi:ankyrin repeat domain-containing protein [Streptomyces sp. NPDC093509]|uniref:ankyrin repeat domain-containing protein n=1 Tax=Streptomyces sp. NPDC093509 TaxID=3154982 RepID=UPI00344C2954